jgi:aryl-alcohol dehydrogenase-like predicted oxidoreductase
MNYQKLGESDLRVSEVCLGTMTWGQQNTQQDSFQQIYYALEQNINFIDTAEMYSVPPSKETCGVTETYIGNWISNNKAKRKDIVLATKTAGVGVPWIREGGGITGKSIRKAIDGSLKRLQTDYIDLYQLHWPNRPGPQFNRHWPGMIDYASMDASREQEQHLEILTSLGECIAQGKIRYAGLSNDTPWGIQQYLHLAEIHNLTKMVSVQNEFSLLHLTDSPHVIESCVLNNVAYLPWSPLAGGGLSGKYRHGALPPGCRWTMQQRNGIFRDTSQSHAAIELYQAIAEQHSMSLAQMSLAWVYQFRGVTSTIIGATSMEQLKENIGAYQLTLSDEQLQQIAGVIKRYPIPF